MFGWLVDRVAPYFQRQPRYVTVPPPAPQPGAAGPAATLTAAPAATQPAPPADLARRREELARRFAELQWDLGGLAYEMAVRGRMRAELLTPRVAELQQIDAQLATIDGMLRTGNSAPAGACPTCSAPYQAGAVYCWQCGRSLRPQQPVASAPPPRPALPASPTRPAPAPARNPGP
jgi:hypothetical protein